MTDRIQRIFELLSHGNIAKTALRRKFSADSCINTTRVLQDVYRAFGVMAEAVSVRSLIYSPRFVERVRREGRLPDADELHTWTSEPGVWSVGIGFGNPLAADRWAGHLVLRAGQDLIDATLDQANRADADILMPSMLFVRNMPEDFWSGQNRFDGEINGCRVVYIAKPQDNSYMGSAAWSGIRPHIEGAVAHELIQYLTRKLGGQ